MGVTSTFGKFARAGIVAVAGLFAAPSADEVLKETGLTQGGVFSSQAHAATFQENREGTNIVIDLNGSETNANIRAIGLSWIQAERNRSRTKNYESALEEATQGYGSTDAEEARKAHLCHSGSNDEQIEVRFTSIGGIRQIKRAYKLNDSYARHAYKANLTAVIRAGGRTHRVTDVDGYLASRPQVRQQLAKMGVPLSGAPIQSLNQRGCRHEP